MCWGVILPTKKCSLKPKLVEFGTVSVGSSTSKVITLRNNGKFPTVFQVNAGSVPGGVSVSPMKGSLDVGASFDLTVTFAPTVAVSHNSKVVRSCDTGFFCQSLEYTCFSFSLLWFE